MEVYTAGIIYAGFLLPICWFDLTRFRIPDWLSLSCGTALFLVQALLIPERMILLLAGAAGPVIFLLLLRRLPSGGIGLGDVKFSASTGLLLPGLSWLPALGGAALLALAILLPGILLGKVRRNSRVPFAPFMGAGTLIVKMLSLHGWNPLI